MTLSARNLVTATNIYTIQQEIICIFVQGVPSWVVPVDIENYTSYKNANTPLKE